jgi:uncharacterized protein (TIGR03435 family)
MRGVILCTGLVCLASAAENPIFETVSLAPNHSGSHSYFMNLQAKPEPVKLTMQNVSLRFCVQEAYSVKEYQVSGPNWINRTRYDIVATLAPGVAPDQVWPALQRLLFERLRVSIRKETKELRGYTLTVAKSGPKFHRASDRSSGKRNAATLRLDNASIAKFCDEISRRMKRPVVDATGLTGSFDFELSYGVTAHLSGPSIFSALERQLGLKLETGKVPVDLLVFDRAVRTPVVP